MDAQGCVEPAVDLGEITLPDGIGKVPGDAGCHDTIKKRDKHNNGTHNAEEAVIGLAQSIQYPSNAEKRKCSAKDCSSVSGNSINRYALI